MSNKSSADLYYLIKSLSKTEKRYFTTNTLQKKGKKENLFEILFNTIEDQREFNEDTPLIKGNKIPHLPMIKKRLFEMILKSMEMYHLENSLENKLRSTINKIEFLFHKGLNEPCAKLIKKAKKVAKENELWEQLIEILNLESLLLAAYNRSTYADRLRLKSHKEALTALHQLKNRLDYLKLSIEITELGRGRQTIRKKNEIKYINSILANPLLKSEKMALSLKSKSTFYFLLSRGALMKFRNKKALQYADRYVKFSTPRKNPSLASILTYFNSLAGYLQFCLEEKNYSEAEIAVIKLKSIPLQYNIKGSDFLQSSIYSMSTGSLFSIYLDTGQFHKSLQLVREVEENKVIIEKNLSTSNKIVLNFYFFYTYFGLENYRSALVWLNNTIDLIAKTGLREDIYSICKILILLVHYELGNLDLLSYIGKSAFRKLDKLKELHQFEFIMLDFFNKKLPEVNNDKERIELFQALKDELEKLKNYSERSAMRNFDLISWIDSKIENHSFMSIVQKKAEKEFTLQAAK
ncbi:MAG: hypothetical protein HYU69_04115 [Bacteroidetes bacterium]|nr:hypothetical protein [Bacteroidota bacterium]